MARRRKNIIINLGSKKRLLLGLPNENVSLCGHARKCLRDSLQTVDVKEACILRREVRALLQMVRQQHFHRTETRLEAEISLVRLVFFVIAKSLGIFRWTGSSVPGYSANTGMISFHLELLLYELELNVLIESMTRLPLRFQEMLVASIIQQFEQCNDLFLDEALFHKVVDFLVASYEKMLDVDAESGDSQSNYGFKKKLKRFLLLHGQCKEAVGKLSVVVQNSLNNTQVGDRHRDNSPSISPRMKGPIECGIKLSSSTEDFSSPIAHYGRYILPPDVVLKSLFVIQEEFSSSSSSSGKQKLEEAMTELLERSPLSKSFLRYYFSEDRLSGLKQLLKDNNMVKLRARRQLTQTCNRLSSHDISILRAKELMITSIIAPDIVVETLLDRGVRGGQRELVVHVFSVLSPLAETFEFYSGLSTIMRRSLSSRENQLGSLTHCSLVSRLISTLLENSVISPKILENLLRNFDPSRHALAPFLAIMKSSKQ